MARKGRDSFQVDFRGIESLTNELKAMDKKKDVIIRQEYTKYGLLVEEGAKALAPHDKGDLEDTISSSGARLSRGEISVEVSVGSKYGRYQHDLIPRKGKYPKWENGAKFPGFYRSGRGLRTRTKPKWRGEGAGRLFLERTVRLTEKDFQEMNERALNRITRGW